MEDKNYTINGNLKILFQLSHLFILLSLGGVSDAEVKLCMACVFIYNGQGYPVFFIYAVDVCSERNGRRRDNDVSCLFSQGTPRSFLRKGNNSRSCEDLPGKTLGSVCKSSLLGTKPLRWFSKLRFAITLQTLGRAQRLFLVTLCGLLLRQGSSVFTL